MLNYRYDKLNALTHLQNRKAHYRRVIDAKKNIDFGKQQTHYLTHINLNTKYANNKQKQIREDNIKLAEKLKQIYRKNGVLQNNQLSARKFESNQILSHHRNFHNKTAEHKLRQGNLILAQKLNSAKPMIGTKRQWKQHFGAFKIHKKQLRKYSISKDFDPENLFKNTLTSHKRILSVEDLLIPEDEQLVKIKKIKGKKRFSKSLKKLGSQIQISAI